MQETEFAEINQINSFFTFLWSIDWRDPWLMGLITFHVVIFVTATLTKNHGNFQACLFLFLLVLVYFSESINRIASTNWKIFSRQQYFDSNGLFISIVFSMPILLNCMILVGSWLYHSTQLMTNLKVAQLKERLKKERQRLLEQEKQKIKDE